MDLDINGKRVTVKDKLGARDGWAMAQRAASRGAGMPEFESAVEELTIMVESWEFDGDPRDPQAYERLDFFEVMDIYLGVQQAYQERMSNLKNLPKTST